MKKTILITLMVLLYCGVAYSKSPPVPPAGTAAELTTGTETKTRVWSPKILSDEFSGASAEVVDADVAAAGNGDTNHAYSKDDIHDYLIQIDTNLDGVIDDEDFTWTGTHDFSGATVTFGLEDADVPTTLTLETISGTPVITNGPRIGTDDTDHLIDEASNGAGSATLYIGNESILASGDIGVSVQGYNANTTTLGATIGAAEVDADVATQAELDAVAALVDTDDEIIAIINASPSTQIGVPAGGTGVGTLTDGGILLGSGTGAITALGVATNGQIPIGDGTTDPVLATITGTANEVTVTNGAGTITLSLPNDAGTDISADLEEEAHASEHQDGGADEIAVTAGMMNTGTNASAATFWRGDNTWATPGGSGDVTGVGDCTSGDCLDGSSDGGTYILLYDGDSNSVQLDVGDLSGNITVNLPTSSGTLLLSGGALGTPSSGTGTNITGIPTILTTDSGDAAATWYPIISDGATGEQAMQTDSGLAFNPSTNVLTVNGGVNVPANSTAAQYQDFYEDTDDGPNYFRITGQALTGDRTLTLPDFNAALLASGNVDATGDLADGAVDPVHLADGDYGPFTMSSGTFSMDANSIDSDQYVDSSIDPAHVASGVWDFGTSVEGDTLTEGGNAVYNATETPGGELGGTWASPTVDDTGITLTSITIGALLGVDSIDATGAVDMDYGSADVTDHTFTTDGGTTIIDGSTITPAPADDPLIYFDPSTASESEWWIGINHDSVGDDNDSIEIRQSATPGTNVEFEIEPDADIIIGSGADADTTITIDNDDTDGVIQRMADEKTWEFNNLLADTPQTYDATDAADTDVTVGTELTSSIVIITGDNDTDNDEIDLQNGNVAGQILIFIAGSGIDADDTITIDTTTDSTCTGCVTTVLNATGDTRTLIWTGATWATISSTDAP